MKYFIMVVCLEQCLKNEKNFRFGKEALCCFISAKDAGQCSKKNRSIFKVPHMHGTVKGEKCIIISKHFKSDYKPQLNSVVFLPLSDCQHLSSDLAHRGPSTCGLGREVCGAPIWWIYSLT